MQIYFDHGATVAIDLLPIAVKSKIEHMFKHLSHVKIPFKSWDNPFEPELKNHQQLVGSLIAHAIELGISVDQEKCMSQDQQYFNSLHQLFEKHYNGDLRWLSYHEHIHLCEKRETAQDLVIDYRESAGPVTPRMDLSLLNDSTLQVQAGDVYIIWTELGKTPYQYWRDQEPNDLQRLCELSKPWLHLRPQLRVSFQDKSLLFNAHHREEFEQWWKLYHDAWCGHWNIKSWSFEDMFAGLVIGKLNYHTLKTYLEQKHFPVYVKLD